MGSDEKTATEIVNELGAVWSPNFDQWAATGGADGLICALCQTCPCSCPPFGSDEYFALLDKRHGKQR